jgi:hypothetical protein
MKEIDARQPLLQFGHGPETVENRSRCKGAISRLLERALRAEREMDGQKREKRIDLIR